ncbi:MAG: iron-containing alcohol dehydrogenase [Candidatus Coproplasma sp.]
MNSIKKIYCRIYQTAFRAAIPFLPYRQPEILNSISEVERVLKNSGVKSVMLVTDSGLKKLGTTLPLEELIVSSGISLTVYDKTQANPTFANVEEALSAYMANGCQALIAFGGGSSIDCAKAVGARVAYPKKTLDRLKGTLRVLRKIPTLIAIPTTAGTGSEDTLAAVITDGESKHKYTMNDFTLIPRYAVLDPEVTYSLPPHLTATTGMDALTHAVEAFIGRSTTKYTRSMALKATEIIFKNIYTAYSDGSNLTARENMLNAAYMAGIAFSQSYVGYIHAVAHSLGGQYNMPHGLTNAVLMPHVLEAYGDKAHKKLHKLGIAAGIATEQDGHKQGAEKFIAAIRELNSSMGIPEKLNGIREEDIPSMAKNADREANPLYPVPVEMNAKQLEELYRKVV